MRSNTYSRTFPWARTTYSQALKCLNERFLCFMNSEDHPQRMFCNFSEPVLSEVKAISTEISLPKDELLFRPGWQSKASSFWAAEW